MHPVSLWLSLLDVAEAIKGSSSLYKLKRLTQDNWLLNPKTDSQSTADNLGQAVVSVDKGGQVCTGVENCIKDGVYFIMLVHIVDRVNRSVMRK